MTAQHCNFLVEQLTQQNHVMISRQIVSNRLLRSLCQRRALASYDPKWSALVQKELGGARGPDSLERVTPEGLTLKPVYTAEDAPQSKEFPGVFPFTRGPYASMYTAKPWTVRQYAGFSTAEESNAFYKKVRHLFPLPCLYCPIPCL